MSPWIVFLLGIFVIFNYLSCYFFLIINSEFLCRPPAMNCDPAPSMQTIHLYIFLLLHHSFIQLEYLFKRWLYLLPGTCSVAFSSSLLQLSGTDHNPWGEWIRVGITAWILFGQQIILDIFIETVELSGFHFQGLKLDGQGIFVFGTTTKDSGSQLFIVWMDLWHWLFHFK